MKAILKNDTTKAVDFKKVDDGKGSIYYQSYNKKYRAEELYILGNEPTFYNKDFTPIGIAHFHGNSLDCYPKVQEMIKSRKDIGTLPDNVEIISCWTDEEKCMLKHQLDKHNILLTNAVKKKPEVWYMPDKIRFYINALKESTKEYCLLLDGYDTLIVSFDDMMRRYREIGKDILFNASRFNYPNVNIDVVPDREDRGESRYFNAGCCLGKRTALLKFYEEALDYIDSVVNPRSSEQLVIRYAFAKYSEDENNSFVDFDYECRVFRTFGKSAVAKVSKYNYIVL